MLDYPATQTNPGSPESDLRATEAGEADQGSIILISPA
jgi:hypothetical protein